MRLPRPHNMFRRIIRLNRQEYTVTRVTFTRGRRGSNTEEPDEEFGQLIWVFRPEEANIQNEFGVRLEGDIHALAIPPEHDDTYEPSDSVEAFRMEVNDRIQHGGETYSVETVKSLPNHEDEQFVLLHLDKMENA